MLLKSFTSSHGASLAAKAAHDLAERLGIAGVVLAAVGLFVSTASANMITNGDFSANAASFVTFPGYLGGSNPTTIPGWTTPEYPSPLSSIGINGSGVKFSSGTVFGPSDSSAVADFLFLQNGGQRAYQTVATVAGQSYTLTYDGAARAGETTDELQTLLYDATTGTAFAQQNDLNISDTAFTPFTFAFTAPSASTEILFFNNESTAGLTTDVSNVTLAPAVVPEPATLGLFAIGGALGLLLLKRRKVAMKAGT